MARGSFGDMLWLYMLLDEYEAAVDSDLSRFHGIDYRDRWRLDEHGRRKLTLRMIHNRVSYLDHDSAIAKALARAEGEIPWSLADYLISDVVHALTGEPHPSRPLTPDQKAKAREMAAVMDERRARANRAKAKQAERQRVLDESIAEAQANVIRNRDLSQKGV
ncbi:Uncharacterised protein [Mycobacteroides abscessus subsp. abscessus]|uniref:hypothetical protein n=1 Tax=Mycobacteroides abscessus TaxID=36809 RepID=UPI0009269924|nr:hypothetical protein [Mycobacteroides abscessus]SHR60753.1 Uncharacterised protein [Mycobacteroides abscessus subsp. abscessus]